jgi:hypothetical protein
MVPVVPAFYKMSRCLVRTVQNNYSSFVFVLIVIYFVHFKATTHYRFEVSARTAVGLGPARVAIIQSGIEPVLPQPPTGLAVTNIEAFSVVLQFTPGFDGNSSITKWIVEVKNDLSLCLLQILH